MILLPFKLTDMFLVLYPALRTYSPFGMPVQLVEHRVVAVLEHQVELPFAPEHLDQVHQIGVFQLLK